MSLPMGERGLKQITEDMDLHVYGSLPMGERGLKHNRL